MKSNAHTSQPNEHSGRTLPVTRITVALLVLCVITSAQVPVNQIRENVRSRIEAAGIPPKMGVRNELIYSSLVLPQFYEQRVYTPAWSNENGLLSSRIDALIRILKDASNEGLTPADYHLSRIEATLQEVRDNQVKNRPYEPVRLADLDLLLTDAFLIYGAHLLAGRVDPETVASQWTAYQREADLGKLLLQALDDNTVEQTLRNLLPAYAGYTHLREKLALYRRIAAEGGWPMVPEGPKMRKGDRGERAVLLRRRLAAVGDLQLTAVDDVDLFDDELDTALRQFQKRHGLTVDGILGQTTLVALNVPSEHRVRQIFVNMERWRWLPQDLGTRYLIANIANFELDVVEDNKVVLSTVIIVGRPYRRTPVFSDRMTYLVINPQWFVPHSIAVKDILPLIKKDPNHLAKNNMTLLRSGSTEQIDPVAVDWSRVTERNFPYAIRQAPGPNNALGRIKFMFPNKYNVYIHDTPARELFRKTDRGFSSGCIRIERPLDLAEYLLKDDPRWTRAKIVEAINRGTEQTIRLPRVVPIHILYWTAWVDENGAVQFRNDIYDRDAAVFAALFENPPAN